MDYSQYHPDWKDVIRPQILKRDGYKCSDCGVRHKALVYRQANGSYYECDEFTYEWAKANGKKPFKMFLQVCHLDHDKSNNDPSNLLTKCPRCHGKFDKAHKHIMRKVYTRKIESKQGLNIDNKNLKYIKNVHLVQHMVSKLTNSKISFEAAEELYTSLKTIK